MSTICILGASLHVGNRGVRALGVSLVQVVRDLFNNPKIIFLYGNNSGGPRKLRIGNSDVEVRVVNCRMSLRSRLHEHILYILALALLYRVGIKSPAEGNPWLQSVLAADLVGDIRGGDSFSDIYGAWSYVVGSLPVLSVVALGKSYVMLPQTYGPFRSRLCRSLASFILRRASSVWTRDRNSEPLLAALGVRTPHFCPDVAFIMTTTRPTKVKTAPSGLELSVTDGIVGLNASGLLYMGGYTGQNMFNLRCDYRTLMAEMLKRLLVDSDIRILLVPHVYGSEQEEEANQSLRDSVAPRDRSRVFIISKALTETELKWVVGRTEFFIGSRMHACIAALSQCVPAVGLAYSDKFLGVFRSAGIGDAVIDLRSTEPSEVIETTLVRLKDRADMARRLGARIPHVRKAVVDGMARLASATRG